MQSTKGLIVASMFDGMSCGQIAFERAGIPIEKYYASEIDKYAIAVTMANYPDTVQLGSITEWQSWNIEQPDIIIGGSPCQGFSFAGKQLNFSDPRSALFFTFIDILKHYKPKYFLLENVVMKKEYNDVISGILGEMYPECVTQGELFRTGRLEPIQINSALVSAQNRNRLYWTNIQGVTQPKDKGVLLKDIIENREVEKCHTLSNTALNRIDRKTGYKPQIMPDKTGTLNTKNNSGQLSIDNGTTLIPVITGGAFRGRNPENPSDRTAGIDTEQRLEINETGKSNALTSVSKDSLCIQVGEANLSGFRSIKAVYSTEGKSSCLTTCEGGHREPKISEDLITWRKLTPIECERLQTVDDNYTNHVSNSQRYKMLGNGWTIEVIAHIFKHIPPFNTVKNNNGEK